MYVSVLKIQGFRCVGTDEIDVRLMTDVTAFIGANGSGKTLALQALVRMFGVQHEHRTFVRGDFHWEPGETPGEATEKHLSIEAILSFPDVAIPTDADADGEGEGDGAGDEGGEPEDDTTIPAVFNHMCVREEGEPPVCRLRLEATWSNDGTTQGDIESTLYWVTTLDEVAHGDTDEKKKVTSAERRYIQVHYVPASRDATAITKQALRHLIERLVRAVDWTAETRDAIEEHHKSITEEIRDVPGVSRVSEALSAIWSELNATAFDIEPRLTPVGRNLDDFVHGMSIVFFPSEDGRERPMEELSDGQRSLFFLALAATVFKVEQAARELHEAGEESGFSSTRLQTPLLTIFAIEEPENHLSPYYLSRIISMVEDLAKSNRAMSVISTHSPSVLTRIPPEAVRHFRLDFATGTSIVSEIHLPEDDDEAAKYVREAVRAFPELYFARFVVLVEGDSEQVVLPRLAEAMDLSLERSFVAVAPLGGRHVNHFWRLLEQLSIPYATLLDLDLGRAGGGFARIQYAYGLLKEHRPGIEEACEDVELEYAIDTTFAGWSGEHWEAIKTWTLKMREFGVFYSSPLDLDMMMLKAFPDAYRGLGDDEAGPRGNTNGAIKTVLGVKGWGHDELLAKFPVSFGLALWYRYRFLNKSKPASHLSALSRLEAEAIAAGVPQPLRQLLTYIQDRIENEPV